MKKSQFTEAQIVDILREAEKGGITISERCRVRGKTLTPGLGPRPGGIAGKVTTRG